MAAQRALHSEKKRRSKKRKSRNEVSSSSESESDSEVEVKKSRKNGVTTEDAEDEARAASPSQPAVTPAKKKKSKTSTTSTNLPASFEEVDVPTTKAAPKVKSTSTQQADDFNAAYLRKITTELADDLDKVREAQDFKASSIAMLVHALKQGGDMFSVEEKRRFCGLTS